MTVIKGVTNAKVIGNNIIAVGEDSKPVFSKMTLVTCEAQADDFEVSFRSANFDKYDKAVKLDDKGLKWAVTDPGTYLVRFKEWVKIKSVDGKTFRVTITDTEEKFIVGKPGPQPGPGPDPGPQPDPNGPFEGLSAKVRHAARNMDAVKRSQLQNIYYNAANRLANKTYIRAATAIAYIDVNRPQCTPTSGCSELYGFLQSDGRKRRLSIAEFIQYYQAIAEGLK